jgi:tetraacyldisaccharide 4'-kinase
VLQALQRAWLRRGALAWLLLPVAGLYGLITTLRRLLYRQNLMHTDRVPVPVVVVGNVVAGGAGKTPVVAAVVQHLLARGLRPGVVSRGYGRRTRDVREVKLDALAADVGDEPLLIARRCGVPVFVAARRSEAARTLLAQHPKTQVLVSDDGLQHLALARDLEICVFDERGAGNGWLLPAGPLRESWPRAVDLVLRPAAAQAINGHQIERRLAEHALRADGTRIPLAQLAERPVVALAGIARPDAFFMMLHQAGITPIQTIALPDHHDFEVALPHIPPGHAVVCTEKDAVKLWRHLPQAWAVPLDVHIDPAFWTAFDHQLAAKLSSTNGSQTA